MATIDLNYRPDVNRSISVFGEFTDGMVNDLTQKILSLRQDDSRPITVFINSNGGTLRCMEFLRGLLSTKGTSGKRPRIITVATGHAGSAAASLLAFGDYAIAYPMSVIHFHGSRYSEVEDLTVEFAATLIEQLDIRNKSIASSLARSGTVRLTFHLATHAEEIGRIKADNPSLSEVQCFAMCLKSKLSPHGDRIIDKAVARWMRLQELSDRVISKVRKTGKLGMAFEVAVLKRVIDFEVRRNRNTDWDLDESGIYHVTADYLLLRDYDLGKHNELISNLMLRYASVFFGVDEAGSLNASLTGNDEAAKQNAKEKLHGKLKPFCYFASAIWQLLQEDENPLFKA